MYQPHTGHKQAPLTASTEIDFNRLHSTPLPQQCKYNGYDPDLNITFLVLYRDSYNQLSTTRVEENLTIIFEGGEAAPETYGRKGSRSCRGKHQVNRRG